jgi:hypothetical protein
MRRAASLCLLVGGLAACGEDGPTGVDPAARALGALRAEMASGAGMDGAALLERIQDAGAAIWPGTGPEDAAATRAQRAHQDLSVIAADVARDLARDPAERAAWTERDPESVAIHDAHRAALAKDVAAYRAWVEGDGAALLRRRIDRLRAPR